MSIVLRTILAALLLSGVVATMIGMRVSALATGREIVVAAEPFDPRDLFRGDYVTLTYAFGRVQADQVAGLRDVPKDSWSQSRTIYVTLRPEGERYVLDGASATWPENLPSDRIVLRGQSRGESGTLWLRFGIERYFVPEGEGRVIEDALRDRRVDMVLAVTPDGTPLIKALRLGGQEIYREGLF